MDIILRSYNAAAQNIIESIVSYPSYDSDKANVLDEIATAAAKQRDKIVRRGSQTTEETQQQENDANN